MTTKNEAVQDVPLSELHPFKNHPFRVVDDEAMQRTVESISQFGVLSPAIARPRPEGGYEIVSGHRRLHAAQLLGLDTLPVIVRQMDDDTAVIVNTDFTNWLPVIYALSDFLIMILSWLVKQSLRAFLFQEVQP